MSIKSKLRANSSSIEESMGVRTKASPVSIAPVLKTTNAKDVGRRPARNYGTIAIEQVVLDPSQPRTEFSKESLQELSASFASKGQLQPIRVRWSASEGKWIIIAGERRWRAAQLAGLPTIACYFHNGNLLPSEILEEQIIENLQRQSLQPMEEAKAFEKLKRMNAWKGKQVADALGIHPTKVSRALALLKLPSDLQAKIEAGELSPRTAYEISKLGDESDQRMMLSEVDAAGLTNQQTRNRVRVKQGKDVSRVAGVKLSFESERGLVVIVRSKEKTNYAAIEEALESALGEVQHRIENNVTIA